MGSANTCSTSARVQTSQQNAIQNPFTHEQMQKILQMLEKVVSPSHNVSQIQKNSTEDTQGMFSWIINTGATNHVTHDKNQFTSFYKINPISIKLPNSSTVTANYAGTIHFSKEFVIFNVLYIPEFTFNLIFVQSLTRDINCTLTFSSKMC